MPNPVGTPVTAEALVALGGVAEPDGMVRFADGRGRSEVAFLADGFAYFGLAVFKTLEDARAHLTKHGFIKETSP